MGKNSIFEYLKFFCKDNRIHYTETELKEIEKFLMTKKCQYVNEGAFSCVFKDNDFVYIVSSKDDYSKEYTLNSSKEFGTQFLPEIEKIYSFDLFVVWKEEILEVKTVFDIEPEQDQLVSTLKSARFLSTMDFIFTSIYQSLSEELQDFFMNLANKYQYSVALDFSLQNIGWRNDQPVFFDILLPQ